MDDSRAIRPVGVQREEERGAPDEVRRDDLRQHTPLVMGFAHQADVAEAEVAQPAVDELRGGARGRASKVAGIDERDRETRTRGVSCNRGADDPAADHEEVETAA